jgi:CRP-like cAMP-binding protein
VLPPVNEGSLIVNSTFHPEHNPLIRKLESAIALTDDERQALFDLPLQLAAIRADQDIVRVGDRPSRCCLLLSGFACTYTMTGEGKRQIVNFHIPGDIPDLQSLHLNVLDNSVATIEPCTVGFITHQALRDLCRRYPRITEAFWRNTLVDAAIFRAWMTSIGQREAYNRIAHLLCELLVRLRAVGLAEDHTYDLPITQVEFGNALGITTVHVNRVFQAMRADGLIQTKGTRLTIPDWDRLKQVGDFDPTYLHLEQEDATT